MLNSPTSPLAAPAPSAIRRPLVRKQAVVSVALLVAVMVGVFVALSTVTPVAFAALGFLPIVQHRLMRLIGQSD